MKRWLVVALVASQLGGCFIADWFGDDDPHKPVELAPITQKLKVKELWSANIGSGGRYFFAPAVRGKDVYVASADGAVANLNAETGAVLWRVDAGKRLSAGVGADASTIALGTVDGDVIAFEADGKKRWETAVGGEILSPPAVADGLVVARTTDGRFVALDSGTGAKRWTYARPAQPLILRAAPGMAVASGNLYAGLAGGRLVAITLNNGGLRWETPVTIPKGATELERVADVMGTPLVNPRDVCVATFQGRAGCFELSNGNAIWTHDVSTFNGIGVDTRNAYVTDEKSVVQAFSRLSGASVWKNDKMQYRRLSTPRPVGDAIAVADYQGFVHWLARDDGSLVARMPTDGSPVVVSPTTINTPDGEALLVETQKGGIYAFLAQ